MSNAFKFFCGVSLAALALGAASGVAAQDAPVVEEVVVTGSLLAREAASLPVNVLSAEDIVKQGSPSMVDLVKSIPTVMSAAGEANQFRAGQSAGVSNINLRGFGSQRTLVLFNGRRLANSPARDIGVDTNLLPMAAIGRVEVLRDGAAATYGSDAISGVVNFITRRNFEGLEVAGAYTHIDGASGDYSLSTTYGWTGERSNILLSAGYRKRTELSNTDRPFALQPFDVNPGGGWTGFGSPGTYATTATVAPATSAAGALAVRFQDPACAALGNLPRTSLTGTPTCYMQYSQFGNLIEDEEHYQVYGEYNFDLTDTTRLHIEGLYAFHDAPTEHSAPSYGPVQGPSAAASGLSPAIAAGNVFYIPLSNPGITPQFLGQLTAAQQAAIAANGGLYTTGLFWRPYGAGGNPLTGESKHDKREFDGLRFNAELSGEAFGGGVNWEAAVTYARNSSDIATPDIVVSRLQAALRGLGGPGCDTDPVTPGVQGGVAGVGNCKYFNPLSTGVKANVVNGMVNNVTYAGDGSAAVASGPANRDIGAWMFQDYAYQTTNEVLTVDFLLNGELAFGGNTGWALGAQYRRGDQKREVNDISNIDVNPCVDEGDTTCAVARRNGSLSFFGSLPNYDLTSEVYAVFGEVQTTIADRLDLQLALRHEDLKEVGSTTNPKVAARLKITDWLALRASAGTTFRAPPETDIAPGFTTLLGFTAEAGGYRPYDTYGNPDLEPETAETFNAGVLFNTSHFKASLDYFRFKFEDNFQAESGTRMVTALLAGGCNQPAAFLARFTPATATPIAPGAGCSGANILRIKVLNINGSGIDTSGLDASFELTILDEQYGTFRFGGDATYVFNYDIGAQVVEGVQVRAANDFIGTFDVATSIGSLPQWKGSVYSEYNTGPHNLRWTIRYIDSMTDTRNGKYGGGNIFGFNGSGSPVIGGIAARGAEIHSFLTHDIVYRVNLPKDITASFSVFNVFDKDPPFARLDLSYDPFTANPYGRFYRVSLSKRF